MRRSEKEIEDPEALADILKRGEVCRIGLAVENTPYVVPVNYAFDDGCLFFHSATEGRKIDMLKRNPRVSFEVTTDYGIAGAETACAWGASFCSVMGTGIADFIEEPSAKRQALGTIMERYSRRSGWTFNDAAVDRTLIVKIDIDEMTGKQSGESVSESFQRFEAPSEVIDEVVERLKAHGNVASDARYNSRVAGGLRKEIAYHDEDFLQLLGGSITERTCVNAAVDYLAGYGLVSEDFVFHEERFGKYRDLIKTTFRGGWTSFTPVMERLMYTLAEIRKPSRLLELGCFWGNTLAWFAGPAIGEDKIYKAEEIIGVDTDEKMIHKADANFGAIGASEDVSLRVEDARRTVLSISGNVDFLYLEAKTDEEPLMYLDLLRGMYDKLPKGAWVLAHDIYDKDVIRELVPYTDWVRDKAHFETSIAFDVDFCGLELSIK